MFCMKCGAQLADGSVVCPYCGQSLAAQADKRPYEPLLGMILGIAAAVFAFVIYFCGIFSSIFGSGISWLLYVLVGLLAVAALVFSILGLKTSIRTGGRKYVAGIVFSSVGLGCVIGAFALLLIGGLLSGLLRTIIHTSSFYF